jgi:hypothetical protein
MAPRSRCYSFFGRVPQWIVEGGFMRWSDRYDGL